MPEMQIHSLICFVFCPFEGNGVFAAVRQELGLVPLWLILFYCFFFSGKGVLARDLAVPLIPAPAALLSLP